MIETKTCTECREDLPIASFYPHPHTKDRRQPICMGCKFKLRQAGPVDHGYAERHEARRKEEAEIAARLKIKDPEPFSDNRSSFAELFTSNRVIKARWKAD